MKSFLTLKEYFTSTKRKSFKTFYSPLRCSKLVWLSIVEQKRRLSEWQIQSPFAFIACRKYAVKVNGDSFWLTFISRFTEESKSYGFGTRGLRVNNDIFNLSELLKIATERFQKALELKSNLAPKAQQQQTSKRRIRRFFCRLYRRGRVDHEWQVCLIITPAFLSLRHEICTSCPLNHPSTLDRTVLIHNDIQKTIPSLTSLWYASNKKKSQNRRCTRTLAFPYKISTSKLSESEVPSRPHYQSINMSSTNLSD